MLCGTDSRAEALSEREDVRKSDPRFTLSGLLTPGEHSSEVKKQTKTEQQSGWSISHTRDAAAEFRTKASGEPPGREPHLQGVSHDTQPIYLPASSQPKFNYANLILGLN